MRMACVDGQQSEICPAGAHQHDCVHLWTDSLKREREYMYLDKPNASVKEPHIKKAAGRLSVFVCDGGAVG